MKALSLHITGVVQGVGFRPFVYTLASRHSLTGWVYNSSEGVFCLVQGEDLAVDRFLGELRREAPPIALIESVIAEEVEPEPLDTFEIRESSHVEGAMTLVSPDVATCEACAAELTDTSDRRYRYPFVNCTNCGPRFTIIADVPYDRPLTTMRDFPMCAECAAEYGDPSDRRFHAQPDACFVCGPRLYLNLGPPEAARMSPAPDPPLREALAALPPDAEWTPERETRPRPHRDRDAERVRSDAIISAVIELLCTGGIVAIKGLGGFHLACDATDEDAVLRLRERKRRWGKPLAIMCRDLEQARTYCLIGSEEEGLLSGTVRPIVLLRRTAGKMFSHSPVGDEVAEEGLGTDVSPAGPDLAPSVAGDLTEMGVMLPYTPLHHLLLAEVGRPLVMTSGNISEEPIATDNAEALERLKDIADAFLLHDRDIYSRYDDSVTRVVGGLVTPVRRARGYSPHPLSLPFASDVDILAAGPEQKNTFTLVKGERAFMSQHIGDMENLDTLAHFKQTLELYKRLFRIDPQLIAYDLHPEYLSTKFALGLGLPTVGVQHHHAHVVSVAAEHGISDPVIGVAFDGTGYGTDGHIWGGEFLLAEWGSFVRLGHLAEAPMPGGVAAIRRPAQMAVGTLQARGLLEHPGADALKSRFAEGELEIVRRMIERNVNSPMTSSMGRLFDSVAAIAGVRDDVSYEGQAAIELEAVASRHETASYEFALEETDDAMRIDPTPVLVGVLDDVASGTSADRVSARFHAAVVRCIVNVCTIAAQRAETRYVALAGGVFMNRLVLDGAMRGIAAAGLLPLAHERLPMNDGAVSYGQAVVAWARRHEV